MEARRAYSILPHRFEDQRTVSILTGLKAVGFEVFDLPQLRGRGPLNKDTYPVTSPHDLLVTWTRHEGSIHQACTDFETRGGRVLVCEEAHIRRPIRGGEQHFCLSIHDHNGAGINCPDLGPSRFDDWQRADPDGPTNLKRLWHWKSEPRRNKILVRQQRGIGSPRVRCPSPQWHSGFANVLRAFLTDFEVIPIEHPKNIKKRGGKSPAPAELFKDVAALVTWNSHTAAEALAEGVPIYTVCPFSFWGAAARHGDTPQQIGAAIDNDYVRLQQDDCRAKLTWEERRVSTFRRYAWCQWSHTEIRNGVALAWLVGG